MKTMSVRMVAFLILLAAASARAQTANVYLDVKRQATTKDSNTHSSSSYYVDKDYARSLGLAATVKNMGREPQRMQVEWFFIAKTLNGKTRWIFDQGAAGFELPGTAHTNMSVVSAQLQSSVQSYSGYYREQSGSKIDGYIVRVKVAGRMAAVAGSSRPMETLGRDEKALNELVELSEKMKPPTPPVPVRPGAAVPPAGTTNAAPARVGPLTGGRNIQH